MHACTAYLAPYQIAFVTQEGLFQSGQQSTPQLLIDAANLDCQIIPMISPDKAFVPCARGGLNIESALFLLDVTTGERTEIVAAGPTSAGSWSSDSRHFAYMSGAESYSAELFIFYIETGDSILEPVPKSLELDVRDVTWSPDNLHMAMTIGPNWYREGPGRPDNPDELFVYDMTTKSLLSLGSETFGHCKKPAWSPSGEWIAAICQLPGEYGQIVLFSTQAGSGETPRLLYLGKNESIMSANENLDWIRNLNWTPDSEAVLYTAWSGKGESRLELFEAFLSIDRSSLVSEYFLEAARLQYGFDVSSYP